jgi:hypothetical protein
LEYLENKEEWIFSGSMTRELLKMVFSFYDFYDRLLYAFPSESYITNNIKNKNINLLKREGTQIINDEGEVIRVNNVLSNEAINLEKPPMIDNFYWINSNHFQR